MPIYDFKCSVCDLVFEAYKSNGGVIFPRCPKCSEDSEIKQLPSYPGGYSIKGNNSASTRPNGGAFRSKKNG